MTDNFYNKTTNIARTIIFFVALVFSLAASATAPKKEASDAFQSLPLEELRTFSEVYYYVKSTYVEEVDDKTLITAAIKGMVGSLDSHSR
ncbi:MAG: hypothetical protein Q9M92_05985, partial [Enterobacterales bacterium]|nr:hypothetical protein [Enterobacterales bacterium]